MWQTLLNILDTLAALALCLPPKKGPRPPGVRPTRMRPAPDWVRWPIYGAILVGVVVLAAAAVALALLE